MKVTNLTCGLMTMALLAVAAVTNAAPVNYNGATYTQDFNGLPLSNDSTADVFESVLGKGPHPFQGVGAPVTLNSTGMEGWYFGNQGSNANTEYRAHNGSRASSDGRGVVSLGDDQSSERALGAVPTGNSIGNFGLALVNNTSDTFISIDVSFVGEQWRRGNVAAPNFLTFSYGVDAPVTSINDGVGLTDVPQLLFTGPNTQVAPTEVAIDGNDAANQTALAHTIGGLNWQPGQTLILRWLMSEQSGQDDGIAIDNLSLTANVAPIPEPSGLVIAGLGLMGLLGFRRRRRS